MTKFINYGRQCIEEDDIQSVVETLRSDFLTQGPKVKEFEESLASYCGAKYAVAFSSGTAALHGAYFAMGLGEGEEIITSPMTFLATSNAALYLGGKPVFVDVEPDTGNVDANLIESAITAKTKAIVPVHYAGHPCDLERINAIAKKHDLFVIEDGCHALGGEHLDRKIGDCKYSDMTVFSFHPVKTIATGEGGAVLTNDPDTYEKLVMFRQHGVTKSPGNLINITDSDGGWYYEMQHLGYNYRITDIQAALGCSQLKKLDRFILRRREIVEIYRKAFEGNEFFDIPVEKGYAKSACHLYPIRLKDKYKNKKKEIFTRLRENGLGVQVHYIPVHLQPYYQQLGFKKGSCPNAEDFYAREISLPLFPAMSQEDTRCVTNTLLTILNNI
ncbi:MAG TPA: UDP-4-amino-4,6-dideoxy-N-acetyl-beta-L-altrosamine transaminase [Phycisphaerales bacterium]|nr:UDP-4-amino-4,6-dideoxy-N-acetyl-beta-L-altrosamine transaminase [Phycisphaerales bacterium]